MNTSEALFNHSSMTNSLVMFNFDINSTEDLQKLYTLINSGIESLVVMLPASDIKQYLSAPLPDNCEIPENLPARTYPQDKEFVQQFMNDLMNSSEIANINDIDIDIDRDKLTKREQEILVLIMAGLSNKRIGRKLDICEGTVKVHVKNVLRKLKVNTRYEAALMSLKSSQSSLMQAFE